MSTNRKASIAKRQREMDQKDRVKEREARRAERRARIQERVVAGRVGPEIAPPVVLPEYDAQGPTSLAELRARQAGGAGGEAELEDDLRFRDPDED